MTTALNPRPKDFPTNKELKRALVLGCADGVSSAIPLLKKIQGMGGKPGPVKPFVLKSAVYSGVIYTTQTTGESLFNPFAGSIISAAIAMPLEALLYGGPASHGTNRIGFIAIGCRDVAWAYSISKVQKNENTNPTKQWLTSIGIAVCAGLLTYPADAVRAQSITHSSENWQVILNESVEFLKSPLALHGMIWRITTLCTAAIGVETAKTLMEQLNSKD